MRFLLSIHDVRPGNLSLAVRYLARLRSLGAMHAALLVVPAFHGQAPMDGDEEFLAWLREESGRGTELFLHGYHHWMGELAEGGSFQGQRSAWGRFVNRFLVAQEAEFCGLSPPDQERLLELGLASWSRAGLPLTGFVAPTWHGAPPEGALRERGIGLWETRFFLHSPADGKSRFAPPLAWDLSRGRPRLAGGEIWLRGLLALPLIKVAIHPGDLEDAGTERVLERIFEAGSAMAYADVFGADAGPAPRGSAKAARGSSDATWEGA